MWQVYKHIKDALPEKEKELLIDEVIEIMKRISQENFLSLLFIMYGIEFRKYSTPAEYGLLFIKGIKKNNLFSFINFIKRLKHDST